MSPKRRNGLQRIMRVAMRLSLCILPGRCLSTKCKSCILSPFVALSDVVCSTIMPRGQALGITFQLPEADKGALWLFRDTQADFDQTHTRAKSITR
jgi:hypothetical protein